MAVIVWDRDDVLVDLMGPWLEWWRSTHSDCRLHYGDLRVNPPHEILGCAPADYQSSLDAFRTSPLAASLPPRPEVLAWFRAHGALHRHLVLTGTARATIAPAAAWTFTHFGQWVRSFHVVPSPRRGEAPERDRDKADYLRWLGKGDVIVDDSMETLERAERLGLRTVLFPAPWNRATHSVTGALEQVSVAAESVSA